LANIKENYNEICETEITNEWYYPREDVTYVVPVGSKNVHQGPMYLKM